MISPLYHMPLPPTQREGGYIGGEESGERGREREMREGEERGEGGMGEGGKHVKL